MNISGTTTLVLITTLLIITTSIYAQNNNGQVYSFRNDTEMVRALVTNQMGSPKSKEQVQEEKVARQNRKRSNQEMIAQRAKRRSNATYNYTLTPEANKTYDEHDFMDLNTYKGNSLITDMFTHNLDTERRYIETGVLADEERSIATQSTMKADSNYLDVNAVFGSSMYLYQTSFKEVLIITDNGEYRYHDGYVIVGSKTQQEALKGGKPVTASTFYYKLKHAELIDNSMSLKTFISLTPADQAALLQNAATMN